MLVAFTYYCNLVDEDNMRRRMIMEEAVVVHGSALSHTSDHGPMSLKRLRTLKS